MTKPEIFTFRIWHETEKALKIALVSDNPSPIIWVPKTALTIIEKDGNIIKATLQNTKTRGFKP